MIGKVLTTFNNFCYRIFVGGFGVAGTITTVAGNKK
jgi:hypothetical protein